MIDLHSHILPGLDDGARDLDEALGIARAAVADGIRVIAATPHVRDDYPTTPEQMADGVAELRAAFAREGIQLELLPGGELALDELDRSLDELRRFGLGGNPEYLLVETPYVDWPLSVGDTVFRLASNGITPVIGHPERNRAVQEDPERLAQLVRAGALVQLTAASLDGRLGSTTRACAERLLDADLVHLVGSDAHGPGVRAVGLSAAAAAVGDDGLAGWLTEEVPAAIVAGDELPERPRRQRRSGVLSRLRGR
ncbi:MAG: CpsB/CapC family capsule biosynthesis tyrosine phosphatase [Gaiellaceae bacterium]